MASESILQELFETAKASHLFKGKNEKKIKKACLKYKDKSDEFIQATIKNIHIKNAEQPGFEASSENIEDLEKNLEIGRQEAEHRLEDAERILDSLVKM